MLDAWAQVGPIDQLAEAVAAIIISEPAENARWIAKWRERPKDLLAEPGRCLIGRDDVSSRLGEITCPAIVIHGTEDNGITIDRGEAMAAALSGCGGVVRIPGAAHAANLTHPDLVNTPLLEFLRGLPA
jgi:pimeloyl-ACP methyl ester carboxylesterase